MASQTKEHRTAVLCGIVSFSIGIQHDSSKQAYKAQHPSTSSHKFYCVAGQRRNVATTATVMVTALRRCEKRWVVCSFGRVQIYGGMSPPYRRVDAAVERKGVMRYRFLAWLTFASQLKRVTSTTTHTSWRQSPPLTWFPTRCIHYA